MHVLIRLLREASPEITALLSRIHPGSTIDQPRRHQEGALVAAQRCVHFLRRIAERGVVRRCDSHRRAVQPRRKRASARCFRGRRRVCDSNQTVGQLQYQLHASPAQRAPPSRFSAGLHGNSMLGSAQRPAEGAKESTPTRSNHRRVWKVAGMSSLPSPSSSFLGHRVGSSDVIDETSLNAAFCSSYASCKKQKQKTKLVRDELHKLQWQSAPGIAGRCLPELG